MPFPSLYIKLGAALLVVLAIGWHLFGDWNTKRQLKESVLAVAELTAKTKDLEQQLLKATQDKADLDARIEQANKERQAVQTDLQTALRKLRNQKPPTECKAAIDWSIENKGDLKWD